MRSPLPPRSRPTAVPGQGDASTGAHDEGHGGGEVAADRLNGLALDGGGLMLARIEAPSTAGTAGELSLQITTTAGEPVTEFTTAHEKELHLIVVRADGSQFRHVHPELDPSSGIWSLPWTWAEAGSYRVYADFTPAGEGAQAMTLTRTVEVAGELVPVEPQVQRTDEVDGFTVSIEGDLVAGTSSELTISIERDGEPITTLEPYLGAFGHLVVLRQGDLAYLHAHADGGEPAPGALAGPQISFAAQPPTAGRYLLYLDFQVDGEVRTATFVLDAGHGSHADDGADTSDH